MSDQNDFGNANPQNAAELQAQQDYAESLLNGTNTVEDQQAQSDARRIEGQYGL